MFVAFVDVRRRPSNGLLSPSHGENRGSSPLGSANDFRYLRRQYALSSPFLGSFWGISDGEQGRPTADIGGNFAGSGESRAAHRISRSSGVRGLSDML
jgi:hypothetical protein